MYSGMSAKEAICAARLSAESGPESDPALPYMLSAPERTDVVGDPARRAAARSWKGFSYTAEDGHMARMRARDDKQNSITRKEAQHQTSTCSRRTNTGRAPDHPGLSAIAIGWCLHRQTRAPFPSSVTVMAKVIPVEVVGPAGSQTRSVSGKCPAASTAYRPRSHRE